MAGYCLPKALTTRFLEALRNKEINPQELRRMSSEERRELFSKFVGSDHALEVNTLFEKKLLLKDQQRAMINWANEVLGNNPAAKRDIVSKVNNMKNVLTPATEKAFLADLAKKKLGAEVTADEAKQIFDLSQKARQAKQLVQQDINNVDNRIAYGNSVLDLSDKIDSFKPDNRSFQTKLIDAANIPKSMLTSVLHFSAPFVQGWGMMSTARAWEGFGQMFRYFADEANYRNLQAYIISHPDYDLAKAGKLGITDLSDRLTAREEAIQSTLVEKANQYLTDKTGVPNLVRASSRAFTGYLNYVRFNRFTDLLNAARNLGEDVGPKTQLVKDLAKVVNDFTGRGHIGFNDSYKNVAPALNAVFFSPRKISATMEMFNPYTYMKLSPLARKAALRQLSGSLVATGAVLALAKAMGASVDIDPRSANFAKIQIGDTKLDMTGGNAIYLRLLGRLVSNQEVTSKGKTINLGEGYKPTTRADLIAQYIRDKLSPTVSAVASALYGTDPVGRPYPNVDAVADEFTPIFLGSMVKFFHDDPNNTAAILPAMSSMFGVGLETPLPPLSRSGLNVWGEDVGFFHHPDKTDLDGELLKAGYTPKFPPQTINGVKLTDDQYHDYIRVSGLAAKQALTNLVGTSQWQSMPVQYRQQFAKTIQRASQTQAAAAIMNRSPDILTQSIKNKLDKIKGTASQ